MLEFIEQVGKGVNVAGVAVMVLGIILATFYFLRNQRRGNRSVLAYQVYREGIGRAILLGLEILVAADIIHTVAVEPSFHSLGILVVIILIRTFLSTSLELELEGRWPWQPKKKESTPVEPFQAGRTHAEHAPWEVMDHV